MKKCFFLLLVIVAFCNTNSSIAQSTVKPSSYYSFYIYISGVETKADILKIENIIQKRRDVKYFMADKFPARYFLLKTDKFINKQDFITWLNSNSYHIEFFGEGMKGEEGALSVWVKKQHPHH